MNPNNQFYTEILFDKDATDALLEGAKVLAQAVSTTLGPKGRNVAIDRIGDKIVLHDGVEVAKAVHLQDKHQDMGVDGIVTVDESKSSETVVEKQTGMQFDKGYISPYFVTDAGKMEATVEEPYILVGDKNLSVGQHLTSFLEEFS